MKHLLTTAICLFLAVGMTHAQQKLDANTTRKVESKESLKTAKPTKSDAAVNQRIKNAEVQNAEGRLQQGKPEAEPLTAEQLDRNIAELERLITENEGKEGFNAQAYKNRLEHMKQQRDQK